MARTPKVLIEIVQGAGGHSLYVNRFRVASPPPAAMSTDPNTETGSCE